MKLEVVSFKRNKKKYEVTFSNDEVLLVSENLLLKYRLVNGHELEISDYEKIRKEALYRIPSRHRDVISRAAPIARVVIAETYTVGYAQMREYVLECCRRVVKDNLLERSLLLADIFDVVVSNTHIEYLTTVYGVARIAIVDVLCAVQDVSNGIAR